MSTPVVPPIILRPDYVPEDLTCSICMTVAMDPRITPCEHVFCKSCINSALDLSPLCPIDRQECSIHQLRPLQGCLFRIWGNIKVKCGNGGCTWNGSIEDYPQHVNQCNIAQNTQDHTEEMEMLKVENAILLERLCNKEEELEVLTQDNSSLNQQLRRKEAELAPLTRDNRNLRRELKNKKEEVGTLKQEKRSLRRELKNMPNLPPLFEGEYDYRRDNVVQLSQLISRHLEDKPAEIDSNRIYNCIRSCYTDLDKGYGDNPEYYFVDMRMLLSTCIASSWFTNRQTANFREWYSKQF